MCNKLTLGACMISIIYAMMSVCGEEVDSRNMCDLYHLRYDVCVW